MSADLSCARVQAVLALLPGGELAGSLDAATRRHLVDCPACRKALGGYLRALRALRSLTPRPSGDEAFFAELREDTLLAVRRDARLRRVRSRPRPLRKTLAGVMTAAALFLLGVYLVPAERPEIEHFSPIEVTPARTLEPIRFRNVGDYYGLSGHRPVVELLVHPFETDPEPEPAERPKRSR